MTDSRSHTRSSMDWALVAVYIVLVIIGWVNIYAATHTPEAGSILQWSSRAGKQFVWILTAFGLAGVILYLIPPKLWEATCIPFYFFVVALLVLVIFVSSDVKGSHSWFDLGPIRFQPAEISKISTSLLLSYIMSRQRFQMKRAKSFWTVVGVILLPMLVIVAESETGSALVYAGFLFVLYREGLSGWWLGAAGLAIVLFVSTLTLGSYWAVYILVAALVLCNIVMAPSGLRERIRAGAIILLSGAVLPRFWDWLCSLVQGRMQWMENRIWVPAADERLTSAWAFLLAIKPVYILVAVGIAALPLLAYYAYKKRDRMLALSLAAFIAGGMLVFSTDYIFENVLQPHQRGRIEVLLGLKEDLSGVGYNVHQSKIAIGSGGLLGKGFLKGTQTTFGFVPEQSTDFIFCTVGEEWGFAGCLVVILLYGFLIARLVVDAESCRGRFTRVYGYCTAACVFMHLFINVGMTVGLMPVIGIPLPLLSYGGSSLWAFTILIFIFLSLYRDEKKYF